MSRFHASFVAITVIPVHNEILHGCPTTVPWVLLKTSRNIKHLPPLYRVHFYLCDVSEASRVPSAMTAVHVISCSLTPPINTLSIKLFSTTFYLRFYCISNRLRVAVKTDPKTQRDIIITDERLWETFRPGNMQYARLRKLPFYPLLNCQECLYAWPYSSIGINLCVICCSYIIMLLFSIYNSL